MTRQEIKSRKRFEDIQNVIHEAYMKVRREVEKALEGETERCAKIAEDFDDFVYREVRGYGSVAREADSMKVLAEQIRSGE